MEESSAGWGRTLVLLTLVLAVIGIAFYATAASMVGIWLRSETFTHGFLIVPITLWLVAEKRRGLTSLAPRPAYLPLVLMLPTGFGWLLGHLVDVLVVQQFAFVGMLILGIWAVIGTSAARYLAFPLGFLLFAVPAGEGLIYPMMDFTANFTVGMLRLTGIPVYHDGLSFSVPSGDWSVVAACSGVRYLIASVTLGALYAYLSYTRLWKRMLFMVLAVVVPIIANGLRAYMIVMIGHLSDMKYAVGVDHLIYGWIFFGIVITIMFLLGSFWRDPPRERAPDAVRGEGARGGRGAVMAAVATALVASVGPAIAVALAHGEAQPLGVALEAPTPVEGWTIEKSDLWEWRPHMVGADGERYTFYRPGDGAPVGLYVGVYRTQRQDAELLNALNRMALQESRTWNEKSLTSRRVLLNGEDFEVRESHLASRGGDRLLVWYWYRVTDRHTSNPYVGKLLEALALLFEGRRDGALIAIAAPYEIKQDAAAETLHAFLNVMLPSIEAEIERALNAEINRGRLGVNEAR